MALSPEPEPEPKVIEIADDLIICVDFTPFFPPISKNLHNLTPAYEPISVGNGLLSYLARLLWQQPSQKIAALESLNLPKEFIPFNWCNIIIRHFSTRKSSSQTWFSCTIDLWGFNTERLHEQKSRDEYYWCTILHYLWYISNDPSYLDEWFINSTSTMTTFINVSKFLIHRGQGVPRGPTTHPPWVPLSSPTCNSNTVDKLMSSKASKMGPRRWEGLHDVPRISTSQETGEGLSHHFKPLKVMFETPQKKQAMLQTLYISMGKFVTSLCRYAGRSSLL